MPVCESGNSSSDIRNSHFKFYQKLSGEKFIEVRNDVSGIKQDIVRLENKMDTNHKALHDGYKQTYEKLTEVDEKLDRHEELIKGHDLEIKVMRKVK